MIGKILKSEVRSEIISKTIKYFKLTVKSQNLSTQYMF